MRGARNFLAVVAYTIAHVCAVDFTSQPYELVAIENRAWGNASQRWRLVSGDGSAALETFNNEDGASISYVFLGQDIALNNSCNITTRAAVQLDGTGPLGWSEWLPTGISNGGGEYLALAVVKSDSPCYAGVQLYAYGPDGILPPIYQIGGSTVLPKYPPPPPGETCYEMAAAMSADATTLLLLPLAATAKAEVWTRNGTDPTSAFTFLQALPDVLYPGSSTYNGMQIITHDGGILVYQMNQTHLRVMRRGATGNYTQDGEPFTLPDPTCTGCGPQGPDPCQCQFGNYVALSPDGSALLASAYLGTGDVFYTVWVHQAGSSSSSGGGGSSSGGWVNASTVTAPDASWSFANSLGAKFFRDGSSFVIGWFRNSTLQNTAVYSWTPPPSVAVAGEPVPVRGGTVTLLQLLAAPPVTGELEDVGFEDAAGDGSVILVRSIGTKMPAGEQAQVQHEEQLERPTQPIYYAATAFYRRTNGTR